MDGQGGREDAYQILMVTSASPLQILTLTGGMGPWILFPPAPAPAAPPVMARSTVARMAFFISSKSM